MKQLYNQLVDVDKTALRVCQRHTEVLMRSLQAFTLSFDRVDKLSGTGMMIYGFKRR